MSCHVIIFLSNIDHFRSIFEADSSGAYDFDSLMLLKHLVKIREILFFPFNFPVNLNCQLKQRLLCCLNTNVNRAL